MSNAAKWSKNVVLIDADYADSVAFNLSVNFERMLGRQIPKADLADWLDCLALDGGLRPAPQNEVQCVFLYSPEKSTLRNFQPASLTSDLDGRAFRDNLGEFLLQSVPIEDVVGRKNFFLQSIEAIGQAAEVERLLIVGDMESFGRDIIAAATAIEGKDITLFAMEPLNVRGCHAELLGFSLTHALGVEGSEFV